MDVIFPFSMFIKIHIQLLLEDNRCTVEYEEYFKRLSSWKLKKLCLSEIEKKLVQYTLIQ